MRLLPPRLRAWSSARPLHRCPAAAPFAALLLSSAPALATSANDLCSPTADPCIVTTSVTATPDSVIDVGGRELQLSGSGAIHIRSGTLTLRGRRITTGPNALIRTSGPTRADPAATLEIIADEVVLSGQIDARGSPAGDVDITGSTSLTFSGSLRGRAEAGDAAASTVTLSGSAVLLGGSIDLDGGRDDIGGDISVDGDRVTLLGSIVVDGGDGGSIDVAATETLTVAAAAALTANATTAAGDGGDISLDCDGVLELLGDLSNNGRSGGDDGGGDGGQITLVGDAGIFIRGSSSIESRGGSPDGLAGDIDVSSLFGSIDIDGTLVATADERESGGGTVDIAADTHIAVRGSVSVRGADGGAGDIELDAGSSVSIAQGGQLEANATRAGSAGTVDVLAGTFIDVRGTVLAEANGDAPPGGRISFDACAVTTSPTAVLRSRGLGAANLLVAAGAMTLRGIVSAGTAQGSNTLRFPADGPTPDLAGATIAPAPLLDASPQVVPCDPLPPTPTPSLTPTASPSATPSATAPPPACAGDCDGNGTVTIAELIRAVNIALGAADVANCRAADANGDGRVSINELIRAVGAALDGCGS